MPVLRRLILLIFAHTREPEIDDSGCADAMAIKSVVKSMSSTKSAADTSRVTNGSSHCEQPGLIWFSLSSRQENDDERGVKVYVMATNFAVKSMDHETTFCASRASKLAY
jgi:hypothetical protein